MPVPGQDALVDQLKPELNSEEVERALRAVDRKLFLPGVSEQCAYANLPVPIKQEGGATVSGASQPSMVATMLERATLRRGHRVLEVGAGTGYNAALLAELVGPEGEVITVDIDPDVARHATECLATAGYEGVKVVLADGAYGHAARMPYDRIILTAGAWDIAPAWRTQLGPGGLLLVPLWLRGFEVLALLQPADDILRSLSLSSCGFQRLRGDFAGPEGFVVLHSERRLHLLVERRDMVDPVQTKALMDSTPVDLEMDVEIAPSQAFALGAYLALRDPRFAVLTVGAFGRPESVPAWFPMGDLLVTFGLVSSSGLVFVSRNQAGSEGLTLRTFGPAGSLASDLRAGVGAWVEAGRPTIGAYEMRVYPKLISPPEHEGFYLEKFENTIVLSGPN